MSELNFVHQHGTFHLEKNIKNNMEKKINKAMVNYRFKLKNTRPEYCEYDLDEMIKEKKRRSKI